ncbi:mercuric transporter MerT family protein [Aliikangiella sp. IMCC44359]|uniref:mercuric transporter MerT family protein n=1 Tax=Aliikangiella sp. IMCC44359 TaxID=3459125 RepID=UPI00403B32AF
MSEIASNNRPLILAALAAIGASACCIGPLLLLSLGIGGAWMSNLTAMEPYSPYLTGITVIILAVVFRKLYLVPQNCEEGSVCANPEVLKNQRIIFWVVSAILIAMVTFPYYAEFIIS